MSKKELERGIGRRGFLGAFAGLTSATTVAVLGPQLATEAHAQESEEEMRKARYQETEHVQAYYRTNRY